VRRRIELEIVERESSAHFPGPAYIPPVYLGPDPAIWRQSSAPIAPAARWQNWRVKSYLADQDDTEQRECKSKCQAHCYGDNVIPKRLLEQAVIDAINAHGNPNLADAREHTCLVVARELLASKGLSDETYAAAEKTMGLESLVALVASIGSFSMT